MEKISFKNYVERECEGYTAFEKNKIIIKGRNGVVITDYEFIHEVKDLITDSYRVDLCGQHGENEIPIMPTAYIVEQLSVLLEKCDVTEIEPGDFFRNPNYNARLGANYRGFLKSLREIDVEQDKIDALDNALKIKNRG